jgi:selenide,water dikinase
MPLSVLSDILRGGAEKVEEAGAVVVGGHSIKDKELKFGVSVTGIIDPNKVITNSNAQPGDTLFLTKPLGTGLITTGIKRNAVSDELTMIVTRSMAMLNRPAAELMVKHGAHAATDITGYGLLGHAYEMAVGSEVTIRIFSDQLPLLPDVLKLAELGMIPGGANDNRSYLQPHVRIAPTVNKHLEAVLYDPQTSGGLFIAIPEANADAFATEANELGLLAPIVGRVEVRGETPLVVE